MISARGRGLFWRPPASSFSRQGAIAPGRVGQERSILSASGCGGNYTTETGNKISWRQKLAEQIDLHTLHRVRARSITAYRRQPDLEAGVAVHPKTHASLTDYVLNFTKPFLAFRRKIFGTGTFIDRVSLNAMTCCSQSVIKKGTKRAAWSFLVDASRSH